MMVLLPMASHTLAHLLNTAPWSFSPLDCRINLQCLPMPTALLCKFTIFQAKTDVHSLIDRTC
jgi:hypothetical protein